VESAAREAGAPAEHAAVRKIKRYSVLSQSYLFQPIAVENTGVLNSFAIDFLNALGRRISLSSGENAKVFFFFNAFQLPRNVSTPFFYTTVLFAMIWTSSHSSCY
jgi:hypothetical protein